jgi:hypothetical protein
MRIINGTYLVGHILGEVEILWHQYVDGILESFQPFATKVVIARYQGKTI